MEDMSDPHNYFLATPDSFRKLRTVPETPVKTEDKTPQVDEVSIPGQDAFMAPTSLLAKVDFRSTRFWDSQGQVEDIGAEGGARGGTTLVSEPGSLTINGPARMVVGVKDKLGAVSEEARSPEFGVG